MIQSMTGFGRGEAYTDQIKISIEIKSVNHRYLDTNIRLPKKLNFLEAGIRKHIKDFATRGKVDVFINLEYMPGNAPNIVYNKSVADNYVNCLKKIQSDFSLNNEFSAYDISRFPDVISVEEEECDDDMLASLVLTAFNMAGNEFHQTRETEGEHLKQDLLGKLDDVSELVEEISKRSPEIMEEYRQKIKTKVNDLLDDNQVDERVLATELVIFADKICVDEEIVRLQTHVEHMKKVLSEDEAIGRKLDFLTQEMNREANTI